MMTDDEDMSIMQLIRADVWITVILEDISRKLAGIRKGGHDPIVVRST